MAPANLAVIGAATTAAAAYAGVHAFRLRQQDQEAEAEAREREERMQDYERRKEQHHIEQEMKSMAHVALTQRRTDVLLLEVLKAVADRAEKLQRSAGHQAISLPLIKLQGTSDSPAEAVLGMGLALGLDESQIGMVLQDFSVPPGLACGSLRPGLLSEIVDILQKTASTRFGPPEDTTMPSRLLLDDHALWELLRFTLAESLHSAPPQVPTAQLQVR